jgi:N-acetylglucosaminyl-diphospho-decaprenol L-rhamnosyltransferase
VPRLSAVIVTYNSEREIVECLRSLLRELEDVPHDVVVVDNHSTDRTAEVVREQFPGITLMVNHWNAGFPAANNQAIARSTGDHVLLLNPDTVVCAGSIRSLMNALSADRDLGICGPQLVDAAGERAPNIRLPTLSRVAAHVLFGASRWYRPRSDDAGALVSGAALLVKREVIDNIGLLDEQMFWREDVDYCLRALKAGYVIRIVPEATIVHLGGRSAASNLELAIERPLSSSILFFMKHHGRVQALVVAGLLWYQTLLRYSKWKARVVFRPSPEAWQRLAAFKHILRKFPAYVRTAYHAYPYGG